MRFRGGTAIALVAVLAVVVVQASPASAYLAVGIFDQAQTFYGNAKTFATYKALHVQEVRVYLYWGGPNGVARSRPARPSDPADPAYNWTRYDNVVRLAPAPGV